MRAGKKTNLFSNHSLTKKYLTVDELVGAVDAGMYIKNEIQASEYNFIDTDSWPEAHKILYIGEKFQSLPENSTIVIYENRYYIFDNYESYERVMFGLNCQSSCKSGPSYKLIIRNLDGNNIIFYANNQDVLHSMLLYINKRSISHRVEVYKSTIIISIHSTQMKIWKFIDSLSSLIYLALNVKCSGRYPGKQLIDDLEPDNVLLYSVDY